MVKKIFTESLLYISILTAPACIIFAPISGNIYGGRNKYGDAAIIIGLVGAIPFVISLVIIAFRNRAILERYGNWLERNAVMYWIVIVPVIIIALAIIQQKLR